MTVEVLGLEALDQALAELPQALRRNVVLAALRKAAAPIVKDARAKARRGNDPRRRGSKKQRRSGVSATIGHGADSMIAKALRANDPNRATIAVGPDAQHWYMKFVEFGTARQSPDRFLTPAFEINKERVVELVGEELWKSLSRTARRLARQAEQGKLTKSAQAALRSR